ncbi:MAG: helix-turn-helix domain-containing protein [Proteobacteria bacterium]|nr:helix-turn-helix domain-containing protein [Pseudomonadota bacterium]
MEELRAKRQAKGLTIEEVSRETRIAVEHLLALEDGRPGDIPAGPYAQMYLRAYQEYLGLEPIPPEALWSAEEPPQTRGPSLWVVRLLAAGACLALLTLIIWQVGFRNGIGTEVAKKAPDQLVHIVARRNTDLKVVVDDKVVLDRRLAGGEEVDVAGHDRVELYMAATQDARVEYNGNLIVPQGRQDVPRRLVFIDDLDY